MGIFEFIFGYILIVIFSARIGLNPKTVPYLRGKFKTWRLKTFVKIKNPNKDKKDKKIDFTSSFDERVNRRVDLN